MATVLQLANADRNLSLFTKGLKGSGLEEKLNGMGPFTIVGPINLALGNMLPLTYDELLRPARKTDLLEFLSGYIISGKKMLSDFRNDQKLTTLQGKMVTVNVNNGDILINGAKILARDRQGSNGVIHLLDRTYKDL